MAEGMSTGGMKKCPRCQKLVELSKENFNTHVRLCAQGIESMMNPTYLEPTSKYVDIRFDKRILSEIGKNEALGRYQENAHLLGKIFSVPLEGEEESFDSKVKVNKTSDLTVEMVEKAEDAAETVLQTQKTTIEEFRNRSQKFRQYVGEFGHVQEEEEITGLLKKCEAADLIPKNNPFLDLDQSKTRVGKKLPWTSSDSITIFPI
eukprot:CAMPEP_0115014736 /NCGR_PEP_ID=MMETSP0216-20121206/26282_1 /TAXON_ID=223996 /ORGANISM="Protocruzia adherens, Strain Boccale" /LENGTH=204 /DNA_ID=CAMNT_0002384585 /DNA_START=29 /DNA_END=643 /DNA_ORIENTATION=-